MRHQLRGCEFRRPPQSVPGVVRREGCTPKAIVAAVNAVAVAIRSSSGHPRRDQPLDKSCAVLFAARGFRRRVSEIGIVQKRIEQLAIHLRLRAAIAPSRSNRNFPP